MKKYGKALITFTAVTLVIAVFYIQDALSASGYPSFNLVHKSGDKAEMESVTVEGLYSRGMMNPINEPFRLTAEGMQYYSESSYAEQLNGGQQAGFIKRMLKKHRNFMRGKHFDPATFYENEEIIAYGNADFHQGGFGSRSVKHIFQISVLDKAKGKTTSFEADIPGGSDMESIYISEVQVLDGTLKLITVNQLADKGDIEVHIYDFDVDKEQLVNDQAAATFTAPDGERYIEAGLVERTAHNLDKDHIVINKGILQDEQREDGDYEVKQLSNELIIYNLKTNKAKSIAIPKKLPEDAHAAYYDGSFIYFIEQDCEGLRIATYSISKEKIIRETELADAGESSFVIKNDKLYLVTGQEVPAVYVIDLKKRETLYEGEIALEKQSADEEDYELYIQGIDVN